MLSVPPTWYTTYNLIIDVNYWYIFGPYLHIKIFVSDDNEVDCLYKGMIKGIEGLYDLSINNLFYGSKHEIEIARSMGLIDIYNKRHE